MQAKVQYLLNEKGEKASVLLPFKQWEKIQTLLRKQEVLLGIKSAFVEIREAKNNGEQLQSLTDFIDECRS